MDSDLMFPAISITVLFSILLIAALVALHITKDSEIKKMAIENRCEFNSQTNIWEHCKGPINQEIK